MIKKCLFIPIVVLISLCGGEGDNAEVVETTENTVNTNVEQPTKDLITAVLDDDLDTVNQHIAYGSDLNVQDATFSNTSLNFAGIYGFADIADALVDAGITIQQRVPLPDQYVPRGAFVELHAKIASGYHTEDIKSEECVQVN